MSQATSGSLYQHPDAVPAPAQSWRLYCDAAVWEGGEASVAYALFRRDETRFIGAGQLRTDDIFLAEARALFVGLRVAHVMQIRQADAYSDSTNLVSLLLDPRRCARHSRTEYRVALRQIREAARCLDLVNVRWIPREENRLADVAAHTLLKPFAQFAGR